MRGFFRNILWQKCICVSMLVFLLLSISCLTMLVFVQNINKPHNVGLMSATPIKAVEKNTVFNDKYVSSDVFNADSAIIAGMHFDNSWWTDKLVGEHKEVELVKLMETDFKNFIFKPTIDNIMISFDFCNFDVVNHNITFKNLVVELNDGQYEIKPTFMLKELYNTNFINSYDTNQRPASQQLQIPSYVWVVIGISSSLMIFTLVVIVIKSRKKRDDDEVFDFLDKNED